MRKRILGILYLPIIILFISACATLKKEAKEPLVLITTNHGDIKLKLYNQTPLHRDNFIKMTKDGYYDSTLFHRVINGFMIQGGDPNSKKAKAGQALGDGGPEHTIPAEFNTSLCHKKGALAAARTGDNVNPKKESSGSQFYIVQGKVQTNADLDKMEKKLGIKYTEEQRKAYTTIGGTPFLDQNYTVFGEVVEGLEIIDKIASVKTGAADRPVEDVKMLKVRIVKK